MSSAILTCRPSCSELAPETLPASRESIRCERLSAWQLGDPGLTDRWHEWIERRPGAPLELHPQLLRRCAAQTRLLIEKNEEGRISEMSAFVDKPIRLPSLPGCPRLPVLQGVRWIGPRLSEQASGSFANSALDVISSLIEQDVEAVLFEDLETASPLWAAMETRSEFRVLDLVAPQIRWRLRLPASAEAYWSSFSSKTRYNLRRAKRLLSHDWLAVETADAVPEFLAAAEKVSRGSWQDRRIGPRIRQDQATCDQFCRLADLGALRCYLLHSQSEPVAFAIGTQWAGQFQLEEIGYNVQFADFSPGTILLQHLIDDLLARNTPEVLDFGFGDGAYKRMFGNEQTESGSRVLISRRLRSSLIANTHRFADATQKLARRWSEKLGVSRLVRRWYRSH